MTSASDTAATAAPAKPADADTAAIVAGDEAAERTFSTSILVSAIRCTLTYVVFPWVAPAVGLASNVGPAVGVVIGTIAIAFNLISIRRFVISDHKWKRPLVALNSGIIVLLLILVVVDLRDLIS
ncbi:MAG: hypothetical protein GY708_00280 [Actinomycetia bacterium]|nr:hypothetical protein [Actinomycetes bacterium]MCP4961458.1 hypothetical protein [Actinomycetes bacterium]